MKISARDKQFYKNDLNRAQEVIANLRSENFFVLLFILLMKADKDNYVILKNSFPEEAKIFEQWKNFGMDLGNSEVVI